MRLVSANFRTCTPVDVVNHTAKLLVRDSGSQPAVAHTHELFDDLCERSEQIRSATPLTDHLFTAARQEEAWNCLGSEMVNVGLAFLVFLVMVHGPRLIHHQEHHLHVLCVVLITIVLVIMMMCVLLDIAHMNCVAFML